MLVRPGEGTCVHQGGEPARLAGHEMWLRLHNAGDLHAVLTDLRVVIDARVSYARVALGVHVQGPERLTLRRNRQTQPETAAGQAGQSSGSASRRARRQSRRAGTHLSCGKELRRPSIALRTPELRRQGAAQACAMRWMAHEGHRASRAQPVDRGLRLLAWCLVPCLRGCLWTARPVRAPVPCRCACVCARRKQFWPVSGSRMLCLGSTCAASSVKSPNMPETSVAKIGYRTRKRHLALPVTRGPGSRFMAPMPFALSL